MPAPAAQQHSLLGRCWFWLGLWLADDAFLRQLLRPALADGLEDAPVDSRVEAMLERRMGYQEGAKSSKEADSLIHRLLQKTRLHLGHNIVYDVVIELAQILLLRTHA
jgi:hypothetical protein